MFERIKRWPIVAWFLRIKYPYNSTCGICKLPWETCEYHAIQMDDYKGFFVTCEWCWEHKSKEENKEAVIALYRSWSRYTGSPYTLGQMLDAFDQEWELTHKDSSNED